MINDGKVSEGTEGHPSSSIDRLPATIPQSENDIIPATPPVPKSILETEMLDATMESTHTKRLMESMQRVVPKIKLEIMSVGSVRLMMAVMWFLGIFNLLLDIIIIAAISGADEPGIGETSTLWSAVYLIEGIIRSFGILTLLALLIAYPQRIILYTRRTGEKSFWNQRLVIMITLLMSIVPGYSLYELVEYWIDFKSRNDPFAVDGSLEEASFSFGVLTLLYPYSLFTIAFNTVTSMIVLAFTFIFFGGVYHNLYESAKKADDEIHAGQQTDDGYDVPPSRFRDESIRADDDAELEDHAETAKAYKAEMALRAKSWVSNVCRDVKITANDIAAKYSRLTGRIPIGFQVSVFVYLIFLLALPLAFQFHPSVVPLVSLITVARICSMPTTEFLPFNQTIVAGTAIKAGNVTINLIVESSVGQDELGVCSPGQSYRVPFQRAFSVVIFFLIELWLFGYVISIERRTRKFLRGTSYAQTRREILGFHFFKTISVVCWVFILCVGIFSAAVNPIEMYYLETGTAKLNISASVLNVDLSVDPMFQVGVGMGTIGFGAYLALIMIWIVLLAFAFLPPDSSGLKGWFVGTPVATGDEAMVAAINKSDYLVLLSTEKDVIQLIELRHKEKQALKQLPTFVRKFKHDRHLMSGYSSRTLAPGSNPLVVQVRANIFVLETEILLFHFMHLSYVLAGLKFDASTGQRVPLTWEEKQALVEDSRFTLVEHIIDAETDTHVMVFTSEDRVVVAFRGSVSLTNWQTDFDSSEVVCEYIKDVQPDLGDVPPAMAQQARRVASKPPKVHGGFVKAYETVRERLRDICRQLLFEDDAEDQKGDSPSSSLPKRERVLFVTGHSLGGGLAILCAADLAVQLKLGHGRVAATTWGAPKVGTYSFMARFNRIVRSARRFCMADDLITRLPMDPVLQGLTLKGWWHCGTEILLNEVGNMLIRPTPLERFMFSHAIGSPQAHLRMTYATALMLWVVRSDPDYTPDWWVGVVTLFYKNAQKRLKPVPRNLRERLLHSLLRAGVTYVHGSRTVRDMMVDTADTAVDSEGKVRLLKAASLVPPSKNNDIEEQEPDVSGLVTELLVNLRLEKEKEFDVVLDKLVDLRARGALFPSTKSSAYKRDQSTAELDGSNILKERQVKIMEDGDNNGTNPAA